MCIATELLQLVEKGMGCFVMPYLASSQTCVEIAQVSIAVLCWSRRRFYYSARCQDGPLPLAPTTWRRLRAFPLWKRCVEQRRHRLQDEQRHHRQPHHVLATLWCPHPGGRRLPQARVAMSQLSTVVELREAQLALPRLQGDDTRFASLRGMDVGGANSAELRGFCVWERTPVSRRTSAPSLNGTPPQSNDSSTAIVPSAIKRLHVVSGPTLKLKAKKERRETTDRRRLRGACFEAWALDRLITSKRGLTQIGLSLDHAASRCICEDVGRVAANSPGFEMSHDSHENVMSEAAHVVWSGDAVYERRCIFGDRRYLPPFGGTQLTVSVRPRCGDIAWSSRHCLVIGPGDAVASGSTRGSTIPSGGT